ncbi:MAG: CPBP family intramembrane metalloprotease [Clostridia bacterium]|nr:CPBP family intramembrane metalloprotease [Clostridia bacterium]
MRKNTLKPLLTVAFAMLLMVLSQTVASTAVLLYHCGGLLRQGMTFEELDRLLIDELFAHQIEALLISYGIVIVVLMIAAVAKKRRFLAYTGLNRPSRFSLILPAAVAGVAASLWFGIAIGLFPWPQTWIDSYAEAASALESASPALGALAVCLCGPVIEEILFRGLIYDALCALIPAGLAVVFQGVLFGSVHGSKLWMVYAGLMGCLLGYVRKRTGSLWPTIALHIAYNSASYLWDPLFERVGESNAAVAGFFAGGAILLIAAISTIQRRTVPPQSPKTEE